MPSTYNGIGTHYYGHKNSETRSATCHSCGRAANLESYDTRLWFVVVFIPVIPLGRKRIIDQCPFCKRHYAVDADQWETSKQLNVSGAMERYQSDQTPETAMEAHQQLLNFHQNAEATEFRREIEEKFRQNAKLQAYLGVALSGKGMAADATQYFQRALELRPDLPEARVGMALDHIRNNRLAEARKLLDFLETPGAVQLYSLEPLETLANAYQRAGQHEEALQLYHCLIEALPHAGQISGFRKTVQKSEKALKRKETMLPKRKFSWKNFFGRNQQRSAKVPVLTWRGLAILTGLIVIGVSIAAVRNEYVRRHRTLYIVSGLKEPATVEIRGVGTMRTSARAEGMKLGEGKYHAVVSGPLREEFDFEVRTDYWDRFSGDPVWVLNVGGSALLLESHVTYQRDSPPPPKLVPHFGRPFEKIEPITHPFVALPETIRMESNQRRTLSHLDFFREPPARMITYFQLNGRAADALRLSEWRIRLQPEDEEALSAFTSLAAPKRAEEVLRAGLQRRPVKISWHRIYQNLHRGREWNTWLAVEYDEMLKAEPKNSALLYLRGRIASGPGESEQWFAKARDADPKNPYPHFALGFHRAAVGDWAGARPMYARAVELAPAGAEFSEALFGCRLALQEYEPLEKELRAKLASQPRDFQTASHLVDVLAAQERSTEAAGVLTTYSKQVQSLGAENARLLTLALRRQFLYSSGDFAALAREAASDRTPAGRNALFTAQVELGKVAEAERVHPIDEPKNSDPFHFIAMSLAWIAAGDSKKADPWLQRGLQLLAAGSGDEARAVALFGPDAVPTAEQLQALGLHPKGKAILLAALGLLKPEQRKMLHAEARRLNVDRSYPYQLVRRVTAEQR